MVQLNETFSARFALLLFIHLYYILCVQCIGDHPSHLFKILLSTFCIYFVICRLFYNYCNGCWAFCKPKIWATINAIISMHKNVDCIPFCPFLRLSPSADFWRVDFSCSFVCSLSSVSCHIQNQHSFLSLFTRPLFSGTHRRIHSKLFVINSFQSTMLVCSSSI